jgi:AcrR family transcriptional regulator
MSTAEEARIEAGEEPRMRADARRSRAKLLEAATAAFAEHGADAPLDDIARRAGVGIGTLYRHFPTRLDLQAAVYRSQVQSVCDAADQLLVTATAEQALVGWVHALGAYLVTKRGLANTLISAVGKDSELMNGCMVAMRDAAGRLVKNAQQAGVLRADVTERDLLRLVHGIAVATEQSPEDTARLMTLMLDGLRSRPGDNTRAAADRLQAGRAVLVGGAEHDRGARRRVRQAADLLEEVLERRRRRDPHLQDVVLVAGHAVAGLDGRKMREPAGRVVRGGRIEWLDRHKSGQRQPDYVRIAQRDVSGNDAIGFETADPLVHGGHGKARLPGEFGEAHAPVAG